MFSISQLEDLRLIFNSYLVIKTSNSSHLFKSNKGYLTYIISPNSLIRISRTDVIVTNLHEETEFYKTTQLAIGRIKIQTQDSGLSILSFTLLYWFNTVLLMRKAIIPVIFRKMWGHWIYMQLSKPTAHLIRDFLPQQRQMLDYLSQVVYMTVHSVK